MMKANGFALVLVLWVLSLLTIMAGSFALSMRREAAIVTDSRSNAKAMALAESGLALAELMLMNPDQQQRWRTDSSIYQIDYATAKIRIQLQAETGKIDINSADQIMLQALIARTPIDIEAQTSLVNAIIDWRDANDLVGINGAEKKEYKAAGLSYQPRNKPFQSMEELQLVLGMNEPVFQALEPLITIYSKQPKVDLTQATREVLQVLPEVDAGLIDAYILARRESAINGLPAPAFSEAAINQLGISTLSAKSGGAGKGVSAPAPPQQQSPFGGGFAPNNDAGQQQGAITLISETLLDDGTAATIKVLIKKDGAGASPFQVLKWQRNPADASLFTDQQDESFVRLYDEPQFND